MLLTSYEMALNESGQLSKVWDVLGGLGGECTPKSVLLDGLNPHTQIHTVPR